MKHNGLPSLFDFDRYEAEGVYLPSSIVQEISKSNNKENVSVVAEHKHIETRTVSVYEKAQAIVNILKRIKDLKSGTASSGNTKDLLGQFYKIYDRKAFAELTNKENNDQNWQELKTELAECITEKELVDLKKSIRNTETVQPEIRAFVWQLLEKIGFSGGVILDTSGQPGYFISDELAKPVLQNSHTRIISQDTLGCEILTKTQPNFDVINSSVEEISLGQRYDLILASLINPKPSTVPTELKETQSRDNRNSEIRQYVDALKPGGITAIITPYETLDHKDQEARLYLSSKTELLTAYRIPMFSKDTDGYDIMFLRKNESKKLNSHDWIASQAITTDNGRQADINEYFVTNPTHVLGIHHQRKDNNSRTYTCVANKEITLADELNRYVREIQEIYSVTSSNTVQEQHDLAVWTMSREGSYMIDSRDRLCQVEDKVLRPLLVRSQHKTGIDKRSESIIRAFIPIRDAVQEVLAKQSQDLDSKAEQESLNKAYDKFTSLYGPINTSQTTIVKNPITLKENEVVKEINLAPLVRDPSCYLVSSIEHYDSETQIATKGPIFTEQVIKKAKTVDVKTPSDALIVSLQNKGYTDIPYISSLLELDEKATVSALGTAIYPVPTLGEQTVYETDDQYLSGKVRAKLRLAEAAHEVTGSFAENIAALKDVIPKDLGPRDITARLGTPWIPTSDIEDFIKEVIGVETTVSHEVTTATWEIDMNPFIGSWATKAKVTSEWGTKRRHAGELLMSGLNGQIPKVKDTVYIDNKKTTRINAVASEAAKDKLIKIKEAFEKWIWKDDARTVRLVRFYNDNYNDIVPRKFDGSHLDISGLNTKIKFYDTQRRCVWRILSDGSTYINHAVGAGKSRIIAAAVQMQQQLGLVTKPLIIVPGACLAQFSREYFEAFPTARLLVADEHTFTSKDRKKFIAAATTGTWDAIIMSHSSFGLIPAPKDFERNMMNEAIKKLSEVIRAVESTNKREAYRTLKKLINRRHQLARSIDRLKSDELTEISIATMGIDQIIVDEAQSFRKLSFETNASGMRGIDPEGSQKAWDLYIKSRYVETINPRRSLIMASGTAITNTLAELYSISRFMDERTLEERNLHEFDAWAATFGQTITELELQPNGFYKPVTRFSEFVNLAELIAIFRLKADVVLKKELRAYINLPKIQTGQRQIRTADRSTGFRQYQQILHGRIEATKGRGRVQKGTDILLSIIGDGRHAAIDMRLVDKEAENDEQNKLNDLINNVYSIWEETKHNKYSNNDILGSTQMIFSDIGTFNVEKTRGFSAYGWIEKRLVELGVPENEIGFTQRCKNSGEKQTLFNEFNKGKIRIMVGSSENMGTGVNAQRRLIAVHHLDVPWLPSQIEQREGRIERQGNENDTIRIFAYATVGSYDATGWQVVERKQKFIEAAFSGDGSIRRVEDINSDSNQFAMAKAIASGDDRLIQKAGLESDIARLERKKSAHSDDEHHIRMRLHASKSNLVQTERTKEDILEDLKIRKDTTGDAFYAIIKGKRYDERKKANTALLIAAEESHIQSKQSYNFGNPVEIGEIGGFIISTTTKRYDYLNGTNARTVSIKFRHEEAEIEIGNTFDGMESAYGLVTKIERRIAKLQDEYHIHDATSNKLKETIAGYESQKAGSFELEDELLEKQTELRKINNELRAESDREDKLHEAGKIAQEALAKAAKVK